MELRYYNYHQSLVPVSNPNSFTNTPMKSTSEASIDDEINIEMYP